jgi:hypothetical protein
MTKWLCLSLLLMLLVSPSLAFSRDEAGIADSFVINSQTDLLLFFELEGSFPPKMEEGIQNGIPVTFSFFVELLEQQSNHSVPLLSKSFRHTIVYDILKDQYKVTLSERNGQELSYGDFSQAKRRMAMVSDFKIIPLATLKPEASYTVRIRSSLAKKGLPSQFNEMVTLLKLWDFQTDWQEFSFVVPKAIPIPEGGRVQ